MSTEQQRLNNGKEPNAGLIHEHLRARLREMDSEKILYEMEDAMDSAMDINLDPELIRIYLEVLEEKDPLPFEVDPDVALQEFHKKHAALLGETSHSSRSSAKINRSSRRPKFIRYSIVAVLAIVLCGFFVAQAAGFNLFQAIAKWTEDILQFGGPHGNSTVSSEPSENEGYRSLRQTLNDYGIVDKVAPNWYPDGFVGNEVVVKTFIDKTKFSVLFENGNQSFLIVVLAYDELPDDYANRYEKDSGTTTEYVTDGIIHYIVSNNETSGATWTNGILECSIQGDVSETNLKEMINSIYWR